MLACCELQQEPVDIVAEVAGKRINVGWVQGPVGVQSRNFSKARIYTTGWRAQVSTLEGIRRTYPWIEEQVMKARAGSSDSLIIMESRPD